MKKLVCALSLVSLFVVGSCFASKDPISGRSDVITGKIFPRHYDGSEAPDKVAACVQEFPQAMGKHVTVLYTVDTETEEESALASIDGQAPIKLFPIGVGGKYAFMSDMPTEGDGLDRITFYEPTDFQHGEISLAYDSKDGNTICQFETNGYDNT